MLGVATRKMVLDVCQTAREPETYDPIRKASFDILMDVQLRDEETFTSIREIQAALSHIASRPIYRSFVSMMVRNEILDDLSGAEDVIREGFLKEFRASQNEREKEEGISYQILDADNFHSAQYSIHYPVSPSFYWIARNLATMFASRLARLDILMPQVQRRKNMSQDSCRNLSISGYTEGERDWKDFRTVDLEIHSYRTGERIKGDCEMRMAWKFNDLKPRLYYCIGATQYWKSRFMKRIAIELMESIPSTKLQRRQHPEDIQYYLREDDWVAIWDMASFTTSLSELKHFLYYVAKNLEENLFVQQRPLRYLDYRTGIHEITADKLILEYNETANDHAAFSIWRVVDKIFDTISGDEERCTQYNSGMLGVHGNIGLSTAFHGFHLEAGIRRDTGCSVGDDALGGMSDDPKKYFIPHLRLIGDLQEAKVDILPPLTMELEEQVSKFVKRRFVRSSNGIQIWVLLAFPGLADAFDVHDRFHTIRSSSHEERLIKFVAQVGSFFWDLHASQELLEEEYALIRAVLGVAYRRFNIRSEGSLPGHKHPEFPSGLPCAVPSLHFDFCANDWAEWLWDHALEQWALLPVNLGPIAIPRYHEGMYFNAQEGSMLNCLEDVGCIRKIRMMTEWVEVTVTNRRIFRSFLSGEKRTYQCQFLDHVPFWFDDLFSSYSTVPWNMVV